MKNHTQNLTYQLGVALAPVIELVFSLLEPFISLLQQIMERITPVLNAITTLADKINTLGFATIGKGWLWGSDKDKEKLKDLNTSVFIQDERVSSKTNATNAMIFAGQTTEENSEKVLKVLYQEIEPNSITTVNLGIYDKDEGNRSLESKYKRTRHKRYQNRLRRCGFGQIGDLGVGS